MVISTRVFIGANIMFCRVIQTIFEADKISSYSGQNYMDFGKLNLANVLAVALPIFVIVVVWVVQRYYKK